MKNNLDDIYDDIKLKEYETKRDKLVDEYFNNVIPISKDINAEFEKIDEQSNEGKE